MLHYCSLLQVGLGWPSQLSQHQLLFAAIGLVDFITAVRYVDELDIVFFAPKVFHSIHLLRPADRPTSRLGEQFEDLLERKLTDLCEIDTGINSYIR